MHILQDTSFLCCHCFFVTYHVFKFMIKFSKFTLVGLQCQLQIPCHRTINKLIKLLRLLPTVHNQSPTPKQFFLICHFCNNSLLLSICHALISALMFAQQQMLTRFYGHIRNCLQMLFILEISTS